MYIKDGKILGSYPLPHIMKEINFFYFHKIHIAPVLLNFLVEQQLALSLFWNESV